MTGNGRISERDVIYLREHVAIDEVIGDYVQLKNAGGGARKGLCPFHDEKSPSFHVTPAKGYFHCFGCQSGGDVIAFVMKIDHLSFTETLEKLADRIGYTLTYEDSGGGKKNDGPPRSRLVAANAAAAKFYQAFLNEPGAAPGREFLTKRGFNREQALAFEIGYAPDEWDGLCKHLKSVGFSDREINVAGLGKEGARGGLIDRYRNRLIWPVKDISGEIVGFGARKMSEADTGPKYLNTSETPIYKKSHLLYGLDMAKKEIARLRQVVIVEGYTDVMAAHLSGVLTAVATCGTAFGDDHIRVIRRLLMDDDSFRGEVIFTFDGDAAGQKAALRAFGDDQKFVAQTFVAIAPDGMDPNELRLKGGDGAVRDLIARRVPLFEFAFKSIIAKHDMNLAEGRVAALNEVAPLVSKIKDASLRPEYTRSLAGWLGMDVDTVASAIKRVSTTSVPAASKPAPAPAASSNSNNHNSPIIELEREVLKARLQYGELLPNWSELEASAFTLPLHKQIRELIDNTPEASLIAAISDHEELSASAGGLLVEPLRSDGEVSTRYVSGIFARLREVAVSREIAELKSLLQRQNPVTEADSYMATFSQLVALEASRRQLRQLAIDGQ
jgi:DNA primase